MKNRIILIVFLIIFSATSLAANEKLDLKIGTYENPPKIFTDENGEIRGFWADITKYIAQQENWEIDWVHGTWDQCLQRLENNEIDIMIDVGLTPARQERFAFPDETVHLSWTRIYKKSGSDVQTILDLEGKQIAGLKGSFDLEGPEGLRSVTKKFGIDCEIIEMEDYLKIFQALEDNEIDAGITDKDFGNINDINFNIEKTPIIFQPAHMQFAFSKDSELTPYLIEKVDHHIKELMKDKNSIYYKSMDKYLAGEKQVAIFPLWLEIIVAIIICLIVIIFIFDVLLKHQVVKKTSQLRKSEEQFRLFAENVPGCVSIYQWYPDGHREYIYQGPGLENIVGEELAKKIEEDHDEFFKLIPEEDFKALDEASLKALETDKHLDFEYRLAINDSNIKWIRALFSMFKKENGVILWQGIIYDVTQRKQAEETLNQELSKRKILQDVALSLLETDLKKSIKTSLKAIRIGLDLPKAMLRIRVDPNNDWQIVDCRENLLEIGSVLPTNNRGEETILAYEKKEISVVNDVRKKFWYEKYKDIWEKTKTLAYLSIPCIDYSGDVKGILYLHDDRVRIWSDDDKNIGKAVAAELASIINRKQAEEELKINRERLKTANSILRHDIANDVIVIKSALDIYRDEQDETMLDEIEKRVEKSLNTIQKQRDQEQFIDSHSGLDEYQMEKVAHDVIKNYQNTKINVTGTGTAYADNAIYSVFENIISNAIKHGKTTKLDIDISSDEDHCEIRLADYGIGIPDEYKNDIFNEGFQYGETGHTGIGLYIVQKTIDDYGGIVFVENNKPNGAVFVIRLRKIIER